MNAAHHAFLVGVAECVIKLSVAPCSLIIHICIALHMMKLHYFEGWLARLCLLSGHQATSCGTVSWVLRLLVKKHRQSVSVFFKKHRQSVTEPAARHYAARIPRKWSESDRRDRDR
jgi:hypothetical protein